MTRRLRGRRRAGRWLALAVGLTAALLLMVGLVPSAGAQAPTGVPLPTDQGSTWQIVAGYNTFTHNTSDPHAIDIVRVDAASTGSRVLAPVSGRVTFVSGNCVEVTVEITYVICHLLAANGLQEGMSVSQGDFLGTVAAAGLAGNNGLPHIHFALHRHFGPGLQTVPFTGEYALEGRNLFDTGQSSEHSGETFVSSNAVARALAPDIVARAEAEPDFLVPGWNLVGWAGDTAIDLATTPISGDFQSLFTFNPSTQRFDLFAPNLPPELNSIDALASGLGVWLFVTNPEGTVWPRPAVPESREVSLVSGFNLVTWSGLGLGITDALESIVDAVVAVYAWNPVQRSFRIYRTDGPAFINNLTNLNPGEAIWVQMQSAAVWTVPAGAEIQAVEEPDDPIEDPIDDPAEDPIGDSEDDPVDDPTEGPPGPTNGDTITVIVSDDTYIRPDNPDSHFGTQEALILDASAEADILLRFDLSELAGRPVVSAVLRMYAVFGSVIGGEFFLASPGGWSEDTVTWNTAPTIVGAAVAILGQVTPDAWYEVDLTSIVPSNGSLTIRVSTPTGDGLSYQSKEFSGGSHAPELVVVVAGTDSP